MMTQAASTLGDLVDERAVESHFERRGRVAVVVEELVLAGAPKDLVPVK
jgi:hypothetical protein